MTWGNGGTGTSGTVSTENSLVGSFEDDFVGQDNAPYAGITVLKNGNYVVYDSAWNDGGNGGQGPLGAATWGNAATGISGTISVANSLVGTIYGDAVGWGGVVPLSNGDYVVVSPIWNNNEGAVTWGSGTAGVCGTASAANSLVGTHAGGPGAVADSIGSGGVTALTNGNYVVASPFYSAVPYSVNFIGAATWGNGTSGTTGSVSAANSIVGSVGLDKAGSGGVTALANGNYVLGNSPGFDEGSDVTWFDGTNGTTMDGEYTRDAQNTIHANGGNVLPISSGNSFLFGATVAFTDPDQLTYALGEGQTITMTPSFLTRDLDTGTNVTIQSNDDITIDSPITESTSGNPGSLTLDAGRSILINASINTAGGNLSLIANDSVADGVVNSERDPGNADITMTAGSTLDTGSGNLTVNLEYSTDKTINGRGSITLLGVNASAFTFPAGSTLGVSINGTTPGDGNTAGTYSQLDVSGSINLNDAALQVIPTASIAAGATFTIVQSGGGVSGIFDGLPDGGTVVASDGNEFTISYLADGGDAVVLTALGIKSTPPVVTGLSPAAGSTTGGMLVTITGTGFTDATGVDFGTAAAVDVLVLSSTMIRAYYPAGTGVVDVTVTTTLGTSPTSAADQFTYVVAPTITGLSPTSGPAAGGTLVTITGTNFTGATAVDFGTTAATNITVVSSTTITADSPAGSGVVDVTVTTPGGTSATSSADQFTYVVAPAVTGLSPTSGPAAGGTLVTITGANLTGATAVDFGTTAATNMTVVSSTTITADSPADADIVDVTVTTPGGRSATSSADQFTYVPAPAVSDLSPTGGPLAGGTLVTITGRNLTGVTAVDFGATAATDVTVVNSTTITADSPPGTGTVNVTVATAGGTSAISASDQFTYLVVPAVAGLSPASGPAAGGTSVTITGTGFTVGSIVDFATTPATDVAVVNGTTITALSPSGSGEVNVTVTTPGGRSATSAADQFTYIAAPVVTALSPIIGPAAGGTLVTITGANFTGATAVDFGTTAATGVTVVSSTTITAPSPAGSGVVNVTVTTPGGTSDTLAGDQFTYIATPAVTGLSPTSGSMAGGTSVTITGTGFSGATSVDFGTAAATGVAVVSDTTITADSPPGAGVVNVTVTTPGGTSATSAADGFIYVNAPFVSGLSPTSGPAEGGTLVTITGTDFRGATAVDFGTKTATNVTVVNSTTITAENPAGTGIVDVTVTTPGGTTARSAADQFTYIAAPVVTGLSPSTSPVAGDTSVTITGINFTGATAVDFGTAAATDVVVVNSTTITADNPAGAGVVNVTVTTPGGTSATSAADQFTYLAAPTVTGLTPTSGPAAASTLVTITGTSFTGATAVDFGTSAATNITVVNNTTITADSPAGSGVVNVTVNTPFGTSPTSSADQFTYVAAPAVTGLSPTVGPAAGGTLVTITGSSFSGASVVDFGTTAATNVTVVNSATIKADSPAGTGVVNVTVTTPGGKSAASAADQFNYIAAPAVTGLNPASGPMTGGTLVTITGDNLTGATAVDFGTMAATNIIVVNSTTITADSPAGAGIVDVTVTTPGGKSATSSADQFTYLAAPTVSGLSPASGPVTGGTLVTFTGTGFTSATAVDFGNAAATDVTVVNSTTITAESPAGSGVVNVSVTTPGGKSVTSAAVQFTYITAPTVTGLSQTSGPAPAAPW